MPGPRVEMLSRRLAILIDRGNFATAHAAIDDEADYRWSLRCRVRDLPIADSGLSEELQGLLLAAGFFKLGAGRGSTRIA